MTIEPIKIDQNYQNNDIFHICNPASANKYDNEMLMLFFWGGGGGGGGAT